MKRSRHKEPPQKRVKHEHNEVNGSGVSQITLKDVQRQEEEEFESRLSREERLFEIEWTCQNEFNSYKGT